MSADKTDATTTDEPVPLWAVVTLATILIPLAGCAFTLSFQMLLPVMLLAGWSVDTAWLGPILIDLAAGAGALMQMVTRDKSTKSFGMFLLIASTALSIVGNLAGHGIKRPEGHHGPEFPEELIGATLPEEWQWVVMLLSIAAPVFVAVLVHAFGHVLMSYLRTRSATRSDSIDSTAQAPIVARSDRLDSPADRVPDPIVATPIDPIGTPIVESAARSDRGSIESLRSGSIRSDRQPRSTPDRAGDVQESGPIEVSDRKSGRPRSRSIEELRVELREAIDRGEVSGTPSAESIRSTLRIAPKTARDLRKWWTESNVDRHGLRVVGID